jgi:lipoprotein-releasing system permease protein
MLSSFSLISLIGVMLGVLVLVVVMAVYAGLERDVKDRILGYTPHILYRGPEVSADWANAAKRVSQLPHVKSATAHISDNVIFDFKTLQRPVMFNGVDTSDPGQVHGIQKMLDMESYPSSSADLGIDDRVVISSLLAESLKQAGLPLQIGDKIRLYSTRNFESVMQAYRATERPPIRKAFADNWHAATAPLLNGWLPEGENFTLTLDQYRSSYAALDAIFGEEIREPESELLSELLDALFSSEIDETAGVFRFTAESKAAVEKAVAALNATDMEKMDGETLKGLKSIVLPKEVEVIGVYQASQMAATPDLFVPLPLAQDLAGLEGGVQGIALRLDDAYQAESFAAAHRAHMEPGASLLTWGQQYETFFALIEQQRAMMYFMLSFIILISAFSMMAVMFTVTIQKRREIGVMKALGATPNQIVRVFLYQGMILGTLGAILGVGLGRVVIYFRGELQAVLRTVGFDPFSSSFTGFTILPAHSNLKEQASFAIMAFILCSLAALVPAFFAARSDAAKSLRNL